MIDPFSSGLTPTSAAPRMRPVGEANRTANRRGPPTEPTGVVCLDWGLGEEG